MEVSQWLAETPAGDVMYQDLVTLQTSDPLARAAEVLLHEMVSGVPVVNATGACVGVLSAADILSAAEMVADEQQQIVESGYFNSNLALPTSVVAARLEAVRDKLAPAAEQPIEHFMTTDLVSVDKETPLVTVVEKLVSAHIHRVIVLDADQQLQGIISTTDILAALLRA